ncbi:MAG: type III-A CRISPR-associated RAMP protein Csm3 [Chloroherpetonaceae bacterium]|nr:type III-A CRISPR-associated RAMP protein Csm3 [Chloroherpetonaceae bacterium]MCS7211301.1 type III-A CRISPR-associated RAMP protein Csm3 [Chloroherpetonaceae bacterium]MDW8019137.1 type III-A CRISPR-associated RAMP protein Csm3 [Chloroherpetonaceae bacterium]
MKLIKKIFITGIIETVTGLHIGGSKTALDIGGIDLNVIKTARGVPFIPGSSIKGKLRAILAREEGSLDIKQDSAVLQEIFGSANDKTQEGKPARLIVRDAFLDEEHFREKFRDATLEFDFTESKWENTINRKTGTADHPRQLERVPAGARFKFEMILNIFDDDKGQSHLDQVCKAMLILQDDYLGGQGSRGYGKVKFSEVKIREKTIDDYKNNNEAKSITNEQEYVEKFNRMVEV